MGVSHVLQLVAASVGYSRRSTPVRGTGVSGGLNWMLGDACLSDDGPSEVDGPVKMSDWSAGPLLMGLTLLGHFR